MEILVNRGVVVEAETIDEALEKTKPSEGVTVSISATPRPPQQQQHQGRTIGTPLSSPKKE